MNEVDKYFTDGCSVNENILGIKSRYEKQDKNFRKELQKLKDDIQDEEESKAELENEIDMIRSKNKDLTAEFDKASTDLQGKIDKFHEGKIREGHLKDWMQTEHDSLKTLLSNKLKENIAMRRKLEKEQITKDKRKEDQRKAVEKRKKQMNELKDILEMLEEQLNDLEPLAESRTQSAKWENANDDLQRQLNMTQSESLSL